MRINIHRAVNRGGSSPDSPGILFVHDEITWFRTQITIYVSDAVDTEGNSPKRDTSVQKKKLNSVVESLRMSSWVSCDPFEAWNLFRFELDEFVESKVGGETVLFVNEN